MTIEEKPVKKRGRKTKEQYYKNKPVDKVEIEDQAIIIFLPISLDKCMMGIKDVEQIKNIQSNNNILQSLPQGSIEPYEDTISPYHSYKDSEKITITPKNVHLYENDTSNENVKIYDASLLPNQISKQNINIRFSSGICCFWCCHTFTEPPVFMPTKYNDTFFTVRGNFCSFECCLAYMSDNKFILNKYLLLLMYKLTTGNNCFKGEPFQKAKPRETLQMFGGPLTIEEFRSNNISVKINHYPMTYIADQIQKITSKSNIISSENPIQIKPKNTKQKKNIASNSLNKFININVKE